MKDHSWYICWSKSYHLLIISNWNIRENFSPRLVAPGRLWSPWEAPSSPHLAPGGCLEGQPPEDRLAMILKKKNFQLIKTRAKFSADQDHHQVFSWSKPGPNLQQWSCPIPSLSQRPCRQASPAHTYYQPKGSAFADLAWSFHPHSSNLTASCKYTKVYEKLILKFSFSV